MLLRSILSAFRKITENHFFCFLWWSETESTRYSGHCLAYCTSPGWWWCEAVDGMIGRGNRCTRRNPGPVPRRPPQIPHDLTLARTRAAAVGSRRLTACKPLQCLCDRIPNVREAIASGPALGPTQPVFERVPGALSVRVKRPGCEANGSPPSSAEVKSVVEEYRHLSYVPGLII
jgi:hypothetical protein